MTNAKGTEKSASSAELKAILEHVIASELSDEDKAVLSEILSQTIKFKELVETSSVSHGDKKVVASLPFGLDIVK